MTAPFMRAYALLLVKTCHARGAPAMGGMAAQIPIKNDPAANQAAIEKVRADKLREVTDGCDGTWVAHPGLVPVAKEVFDKHMPQPNQYGRQRPDVSVEREGPARRSSPRSRSPRRGCATTSPSASSTSAPGWPATAACRSST